MMDTSDGNPSKYKKKQTN